MRIKHVILLILFTITVIAVVAFFSAGYKSGYKKESVKLDVIDTLLFTKPDSAAKILQPLTAESFAHENLKYRYILLKALSDFINGNKADNDSLVNIALDYYESKGDKEMTAISELCAGLAYAEQDERAKAVKCYAQAATHGEGKCNEHIMYLIYSQWGWAIRSEMPYTLSIEKYEKARKYAEALKDTSKIIRSTDLIGWEYMFSGDYAKAHEIFDSAIEMGKSHDYGDLWMLYKSKATACVYQGRHDDALKYIDMAITSCSGTDVKPLMAIKGVILTEMNRYDSAEVYIDRGHQTKHFYQQASYYYDKSSLEAKRGNYRKALEYKEKYVAYIDSSYLDDKKQDLIKVEKLYNYSLMLAERNKYEQESHHKTILIIMIVIAIAVISAITAGYYRSFRKRIREAMAVKENMLMQSLRQVKDKNYELMQIKQDAQEKEMELMNSLSSKDIEVNELRQSQKELKERIFRMDEVIRKIESLKEMNERKKIVSAKSIALSAQEQQNLLDSTNLCYDGFVERLKNDYSELSVDDLCLCCLLKMGISSQDQCILLQINDATLRKRKYRLKNKKMQLLDKFETLDDFIRDF
ncbi:MAG: hypothetical protein Q4D41_05330 [Prevotellaceae bacterium]|nr:hypothetical protein [Prevotellaceae bacterium]